MTWFQRDDIAPAFDAPLTKMKYISGGVYVVKTKQQRNNIKAAYRKFEDTERTLVAVTDLKKIYVLINNPGTDFTADADWEDYFQIDSPLTPIGSWEADNTNPVLADTGAVGMNGQFYFVTGAPSGVGFQDPLLFGGAAVTVYDNDWIMSVGNEWVHLRITTTWESLNRPQSIIDYENGIVQAHTHPISDVLNLQTELDSKFDSSDVADSGIDWGSVPNNALADKLFLSTHYYRNIEVYSQSEVDALIIGSTFRTLPDTPSTFVGSSLKLARVNIGEDAIEFVDGTTLYSAIGHTHVKAQISDFAETDYWSTATGATLTGDATIDGASNDIIFQNTELLAQTTVAGLSFLQMDNIAVAAILTANGTDIGSLTLNDGGSTIIQLGGASAPYINHALGFGVGTTSPDPDSDFHVSGSKAIIISVGTNSRPTAAQGMIRLNTDLDGFEGYTGPTSGWQAFGATAGTTSFIALTDTPAVYAGSESYFVKVNAGGDAIEFVASGGGGGSPAGSVEGAMQYRNAAGDDFDADDNLFYDNTGSFLIAPNFKIGGTVAQDNSLTKIAVIDDTTGQIKYRDISTVTGNFWLSDGNTTIITDVAVEAATNNITIRSGSGVLFSDMQVTTSGYSIGRSSAATGEYSTISGDLNSLTLAINTNNSDGKFSLDTFAQSTWEHIGTIPAAHHSRLVHTASGITYTSDIDGFGTKGFVGYGSDHSSTYTDRSWIDKGFADATYELIGGGGDMLLAGVQTNTGIKTFNDGTLLLRNSADTFNGVFSHTNTVDRTYTLQDADGILAFTSDIPATAEYWKTSGTTILTAATTIAQAGFDLTFSGGKLILPTTVDSTSGVIYKDADSFIHNFALAGTDGLNTFVGIDAGNWTTMSGTSSSASRHTALGYKALSSLTSGYQNVAIGYQAMVNTTTGNNSVAVGLSALRDNTTGSTNTAVGFSSLNKNTGGSSNTAVGYSSLSNNLTGGSNTAVGYGSQTTSTTGYYNTSMGWGSLFSNLTSNYNTAVGYSSLNKTIAFNGKGTAVGAYALENATTGESNTAVGAYAGQSIITGYRNVFIGDNAGNHTSQNTSAYNSIAIGADTYTTFSSGQIVIGNSQSFQTDLHGHIILNPVLGSAAQLRFLEPSAGGTNYTSFKAVAQTAIISYSLPPELVAANTVLTHIANDGVLTWSKITPSHLDTAYQPLATGTPDGTKFLNDTGAWSTPSGGGDVATDAIWDAAADLVVGTGANTGARLAKGTALQVLRMNAGATAIEWAAAAGGGDMLLDTIQTVTAKKFFDSGKLELNGSITGSVILNAAIVGGTVTIAFPSVSGTVALLSDIPTSDNYASWNLKTDGVQRIAVVSGGDLDIVGGTDIGVSYSAGGIVTITNTFTETPGIVVDGDFTSEGLMRRGVSAGLYSIVTDNSANWNTAFGWGDHSGLYAPVSGGSNYMRTDVGTSTLTGAVIIDTNGNELKIGDPTGPSFQISAVGNIFMTTIDHTDINYVEIQMSSTHFGQFRFIDNGNTNSWGTEVGPNGTGPWWDTTGGGALDTASVAIKIDELGVMTIKDAQNTAGVGYVADYSANGIIDFGTRWIPDVGFIEGSSAAQLDRLGLNLTVGDVATPIEGQIWYNNTTNKFRAFENAAAIDMIGGGSGGAFSADINTQITPATAISLIHATNNEIALDLSGTANKAAGNVTWLFADITDTATPGTFDLIDLQVGAVSKFKVSEAGAITSNSDADTTTVLGRVRIDSRSVNSAYFSHFDFTAIGDYALVQGNLGQTVINAATGQELSLAIGGTAQWRVQTDGDLVAETGQLIILGNKADPDPTGSNGAQYYNTTNNKFRVYENGAWVDMIGGGSGDMVLASVQTVTGAKTFNDTKLLLRNVANTFNGSFVNTNTADRVYTLPDLAGEVILDTNINNQRTESGTTYSTLTSDRNNTVILTAGSAVAITLDSSGKSIGYQVTMLNNTGLNATISRGTDTTIQNGTGTISDLLDGEYFYAELTSATEWSIMIGDVVSSIVGITGTKAEFDTAVTDGNFMYVGDAPTAHTHPETDLTGLRGRGSATIIDPVATDDATLFYTEVAITVTSVNSHITGTTNVIFNINHASTRSGTGLDVFTTDITLTSTAGQTNNSGFNDATIPANSWVWLEVTSVSGTPTMFHATVNYTED